MPEEKIMQYANFNITFGETGEPMLTHFEDVIYPAFTSGLVRGKLDEVPRFSFTHVELKLINEEHVLVGNYVKDTEYRVVTTMREGELIDSPADVPTAPYSRFIVYLKNHRMIFVRNESNSPDIRSFQATVRDILNQYTRRENRGREKCDKLPFAIVNIVDIPLKNDIEEVLKEVKRINWVKLRFFPLNNDLNPVPLAQAMKDEMVHVGSTTGNVVLNSPDSKAGVVDMLEASSGLAVATMFVTDDDGETRKIKEGTFSSSKKVPFRGNIQEGDDIYISEFAMKDDVLTTTSDENKTLYERLKDIFNKFLH